MKKEKQKRRKKFIPWKPILVGFFLVALLAGAICFACLYHVKNIIVSDSFRTEKRQVLNYVFPDEESTVFYKVVLKAIKPGKYDAFSDFSLKFKNPITVEICGTEAIPVMVVHGASEDLYFSEGGVRVPEDRKVSELPVLDGMNLRDVPWFEKPALSDGQADDFETAVKIAIYANALRVPCDTVSVSGNNAMLVFGEVHVSLGTAKYLREKMEEVACQYPYYQGLKGTLHMENYDGTNAGKGFTFTTNE